jgi:hypothetical protein
MNIPAVFSLNKRREEQREKMARPVSRIFSESWLYRRDGSDAIGMKISRRSPRAVM